MNEDGQCIPHGPCPDGFHRANDDETGRCIDEDELRECENNGGWVEEGEFCPEDELPFCNEDRSNEPCISGQEEPEAECEENFILENGVCTEMSSNCGGEPCTPSQKEDSWTSDVPESSPGVPIEDSEESEGEQQQSDDEQAEEQEPEQEESNAEDSEQEN